MIQVHITDDHKMVAEGLSATIRSSGIAQVTGISHSLSGCRKALSLKLPDVLLLDLNLPDGSGIDFCHEIRKKYPGLKILILTTHEEYSVAKRAIGSGINGYIQKNALSKEVIAGIEAVMNHEFYLCDKTDKLVNGQKENPVWLTTREQELLRLIVDGYTNQEIADKIYLSVETIKTYRKNLINKLGVKNSIALVKMAIEEGLI